MRKKGTGPIVPVQPVSRARVPAPPPPLGGKPARHKQRQEAAAAKGASRSKRKAESGTPITELALKRSRRADVVEAASAAMLATEARVWDPELLHTAWAPAAAAAYPRVQRPPILQERRRVEALRWLRLSFADACRPLASATSLVGAFERWHFGWLLESAGQPAADPLLPSADSPQADGALADELRSAGADAARATSVVADLRHQARSEAAALAGSGDTEGGQGGGAKGRQDGTAKGRHAGGSCSGASGCASAAPRVAEVSIAVAPGGKGMVHVRWSEAPGGEPPLKLRSDHLDKLREMHRRVVGAQPTGAEPGQREGEVPANEDGEAESLFRHHLYLLLLRYKGVGGSGFQAALGGGAHAALRSGFGCELECFASPLNARTAPFCSGFPDVDAPFGSVGSFFSFRPTAGSFQANPPFIPPLVTAMVAHMRSLLDAAQRQNAPLLFATVVGASAAMRRSEAWQGLLSLASSAHGRAHWDIPLHRHGYTQGHAHIAPPAEAARMSSCPSAVFIFSTTAAHAAFPPTPEKEAAMRAGLQLTVPRNLHKASKANKRAHLQKKKSKAKPAAT